MAVTIERKKLVVQDPTARKQEIDMDTPLALKRNAEATMAKLKLTSNEGDLVHQQVIFKALEDANSFSSSE